MIDKKFKDFLLKESFRIIEKFRGKKLTNKQDEELVTEATFMKVILENNNDLHSKNLRLLNINEDSLMEAVLANINLFNRLKTSYEHTNRKNNFDENNIIMVDFESKLGKQSGIEKYFNTPDEIFNKNAFYWRYEIRQKKLFDEFEIPYNILMHYFNFIDNSDKPLTCVELVVNACNEKKLNMLQRIFILDKLRNMLFEMENPNLERIFIELTDVRNELSPFNKEEGFEDSICDIEKLRFQTNDFPTILDKIRFLRLKKLYYKRESEQINYDIGISEEIDIEINYFEELMLQTKDSNPFGKRTENFKDSYLYIIDNIIQLCKNLEKYSKLTSNFDEETCRDYLLPSLNFISERFLASGEKFNNLGKTDILVEDLNGNNLFLGECKLWKGGEYLNQAITQLLERYVTWRDENTAIIIFNKDNKGFTLIIDKAIECMKSHEKFKSFLGCRKETSYSFIFHHPVDELKEIKIELMLFNFYQNTK
jgi:hypothetical protein